MKQFTLVKTNFNHHVSMDLYYEFEARITNRPYWEIINGVGSIQARVLRQLLKFIPPIQLPIKKHKNYVVIGYQKEKFFPYFHFNADLKVLWMYDAWEPLFNEIEKTIRAYKINLVFTASKQSADYFNTLNIPNFQSHWIPEGIDVTQYQFIPYHERTTEVLQLGRKWKEYHEKIKSIETRLIYKYEKKAGQIIFPTREEFLFGLANSKISICVPSDITHPERTGKISTITNRYLQSMASRCLILGKLPHDMLHLFDYNPIIEIDEENPVAQIEAILANFDTYIPLIEKNYEVVKNFHNWDNRVTQIENFILNYK
ncbi:glycosyltransferase [Flavobacterium sp.]|mgnify:FL=1|uniref:glycosyltransferase n=1 Tax=Flavobacterium sp. TaxID=239 RepID=UPI002FDD4187